MDLLLKPPLRQTDVKELSENLYLSLPWGVDAQSLGGKI